MEYLTGTIESIVFYSPDTGYTVCRFLPEDGEQVTIIGSFPPLSPGEVLKVKGKWELNPRFGRQLRVENFTPVLPTSEKGIEKFLASGMILGIGPVLARRIVKKFGPDTIDILSTDPGKLGKVEGVGRVKLREIKKSWAEHEDIRELIIFLQEHNISTTLATKIYQQYGKNSNITSPPHWPPRSTSSTARTRSMCSRPIPIRPAMTSGGSVSRPQTRSRSSWG